MSTRGYSSNEGQYIDQQNSLLRLEVLQMQCNSIVNSLKILKRNLKIKPKFGQQISLANKWNWNHDRTKLLIFCCWIKSESK